MEPAPTRYIDRDGAALAFQVVGSGPADVVAYWDIPQHLDMGWSDPDIHHLFERGATYSRTVYFQTRGFGLSDRIAYVPSLEQQAEDVLAVMDAVGMRTATLAGQLGTSAAVVLAAAKAPERVNALVLTNPLVHSIVESPEEHGWTREEAEAYVRRYEQTFENWGSGEIIAAWDPSQATPRNRRLMAMLERSSATPSTARAYFAWMREVDVEHVLSSVQAPTRVLWQPANGMPESALRRIVELLPDATFHELPPSPPGSSLGSAWTPVADHVQEAATGQARTVDADRFVGTVLFTDVVSSTELLARLGDVAYRDLRAAHERQVQLAVDSHGGRLVNVSGDGTLSVFDGPTQALRCAEQINADALELGVSVRAGLHAGELQRDGLNITGLAVHIGARVSSAATAGQVLVSRTVRDLVAGSGLAFESVGERELKGVPGTWELFAVGAPGRRLTQAPDDSIQTSMDKLTVRAARRAPGLLRAAMRLSNAVERRKAGAERLS
jgi:class 3 adenylate cyclase